MQRTDLTGGCGVPLPHLPHVPAGPLPSASPLAGRNFQGIAKAEIQRGTEQTSEADVVGMLELLGRI